MKIKNIIWSETDIWNIIFPVLKCSFQHLARQSPEVVKRWVNEAQEAVNSDNIMVQVSTQRPFCLIYG